VFCKGSKVEGRTFAWEQGCEVAPIELQSVIYVGCLQFYGIHVRVDHLVQDMTSGQGERVSAPSQMKH